MKKSYLIPFLLLFTLKATTGLCTRHTVSAGSANFAFSPSAVDANVGDTIVFVLASIHSALEVSQATWNANSNVSNGGFAVPFGGGSTVVTEVKTYYYVCQNHYSMGMKGSINVTSPTGIKTFASSSADLEVFPNPVRSALIVKTNLPPGKENQMEIFDISGKCLYTKTNILPVQGIDLSGFSEGVYSVAVRYDDVYLEKRIIVSR